MKKPNPELSQREIEVITVMAKGKTAEEIAKELNIGKRTVETHIARSMLKKGVAHRIHLVHLALHQGWLRNMFEA